MSTLKDEIKNEYENNKVFAKEYEKQLPEYTEPTTSESSKKKLKRFSCLQ